jgi:hypothetical protein
MRPATSSKPLRLRQSDEERRKGAPQAPVFGPLLVASGWEPEGQPALAHEGWLRASRVVPDRRSAADRRR